MRKRGIRAVREQAVDILARFFARSGEPREEGLSTGDLGLSIFMGAMLNLYVETSKFCCCGRMLLVAAE